MGQRVAISPKGDVAVAMILAGSNNKSAYFYHRNGSASVLSISDKKVTKVGDVKLLPEGVAFARWRTTSMSATI